MAGQCCGALSRAAVRMGEDAREFFVEPGTSTLPSKVASRMPTALLLDYRIRTLLTLNFEAAGHMSEAVQQARAILALPKTDEISCRVAARQFGEDWQFRRGSCSFEEGRHLRRGRNRSGDYHEGYGGPDPEISFRTHTRSHEQRNLHSSDAEEERASWPKDVIVPLAEPFVDSRGAIRPMVDVPIEELCAHHIKEGYRPSEPLTRLTGITATC